MADRKVKISVETTSDTAPLDTAAKSVDTLSKKNEESAKSGDKAKEGGINAAKGFAAMGQAAAASNGSIGGLASALGGMAQQLPALAGSAGPIGLALAAFMSWKSAIDAVRAAKERLDKSLRDTAAGNSEASIKSLAKAYEDLQNAIADAADEAQRYTDAESLKDDARTKADLAALELEKAKRTAALDPSDTFGSRRLDLDMAERRAAIEDAAAQRKADRELAAIRAKAAAAQAAKVAASDYMAEQQDLFSELGGQYSNVADRMRKRIGQAWTPKGKQAAAQEGASEMDRIAAAMEKAAANMKAAADTMKQADREQYTLSQQAEVSLINRDTLGTSRLAGAATRNNATAIYSRDLEADRLARQRQEREKEYAGYISQYENDEAEARKLDAAAEYRSAESGYAAALGRRGGARAPRGGLGGRWGSDGRIRTSDDLAAEAEAAAASAERAVQAAAARLRAAKANFERLEAAVKTQRDGD